MRYQLKSILKLQQQLIPSYYFYKFQKLTKIIG
jgi:hypothetical protein